MSRIQADADDYLVKPFYVTGTATRVATHVKMAQLRRVTAERQERLRGGAELNTETARKPGAVGPDQPLVSRLGQRARESRLIMTFLASSPACHRRVGLNS